MSDQQSNGTKTERVSLFFWRAFMAAGLSATFVAVWQLGGVAVAMRDATIQNTNTLVRIETTIPLLWDRISDHEARIQVLNSRANATDRIR